MANEFGAKIVLGGESEYRKAIGDITQGLKTYDQELKTLSKTSDENQSSTENLAKKNDLLKNKSEMLQKALKTVEGEYKKASESQGENSREALKLRQKLADLKGQIEDNNGAIQQNTAELNNNGEALNNEGQSADKAKSSNEGTSKSLSALSLAAYEAAKAIAQKLVSAIMDLCTASAAAVDDLATLSTTSGVAVDKLQELTYASDFVDVSVDTMTSTMHKLSLKMSDAKGGSGAAAEAFNKLGISLYSGVGQLRDSDEVWEEVLLKLGNIPNETERDAVAVDLLGKSANELNGIMGQDGVNALHSYMSESQQLGYVLSGSELNALNTLNDKFDETKRRMEAVKNHIAAQLAPTLIELANRFADTLEQMQPLITQGLKWLIQNLPRIIELAFKIGAALLGFKILSSIMGMISGITGALTALTPVMATSTATMGPMLIVVAAIAVAITAIATAVGKWADAEKSKNEMLSNMGSNLSENLEKSSEELDKISDKLKDMASDIDFKSLSDKISKEMKQVAESAGKAFRSAFKDSLKGLADDIKNSMPKNIVLDNITTTAGNINYNSGLISSTTVQGSSQNLVADFINGIKTAFGATNSGKNNGFTESKNITATIKLVADGRQLAEVIWEPLNDVAKQKGVEIINAT